MCVCCISLCWFRNNLRLCQWVRESVKMQREAGILISVNSKSKRKPAALQEKLWIGFLVFPWWLQRFWDEFCSCWGQQKCSCNKTPVRAAQREICRGWSPLPASYLQGKGHSNTEVWENRKDCLALFISWLDWPHCTSLRLSRGCSNGIGCNTCFWPHTFWLETAAFLRSKERKPEKKTVLRGNKLAKRAHPLSCRNEVNKISFKTRWKRGRIMLAKLILTLSQYRCDLQWFNWQCVLFHFFFFFFKLTMVQNFYSF